MRYIRLIVYLWIGLCMIPTPGRAVRPKVWIDALQTDFMEGTLEGVRISSDGEIQLALRFDRVADLEDAVVWDALLHEGALYIATGHNGRVYRLDVASLHLEKIAELDQGEAQALAFWRGALYIAANPGARLYRWHPKRREVESVWTAPESYIWDLSVWQGQLYVATGDQGRLYRIGPDHQPEVVLDTSDQNLVRLWTHDRHLYIGASGLGNVYRMSADGDVRAIYPADRQEIAAFADSGSAAGEQLLLASIGQPVQPLMRQPPPVVPLPAQPAQPPKPAQPPAAQPQPAPSQNPPRSGASAQPPQKYPPQPVVRATGGIQGGSVWLLRADGRVFPVWQTDRYWIYDIAVFQGEVWVAAGSPGRVISVDTERRVRYQASFPEEQVVRILTDRDALWAVTSNPARVYRASVRERLHGVYTSPIKDAGALVQWGSFLWRGVMPSPNAIRCFARSGNTRQPDATWSDWVGPLGPESPLHLPPGRYFQYRCELSGRFNHSPRLQEIRITFLPQNRPPQFVAIQVLPPGAIFREVPRPQKGARIAGSTRATLESGIPRTALETARPQSGTVATAPVSVPPSRSPVPGQALYKWGMQTVTWQVVDPDQDRLQFAIYIQRAEESEWHLLQDELDDPIFAWDTTSLPDGFYRVRVVASDARDNPPGWGMQAEMVSPLFLVDHTPPTLTVVENQRTGNAWRIRIVARDALSPIARAEYALQPDAWQPLFAQDRILDSREELLELHIRNPRSTWKTVQIRACDDGHNCAVISVPLE